MHTVGACIIVIRFDPGTCAATVLGLEGPKGTGLPGGALERGEMPLIGAMRELLEETGLAVKPGAELHALGERATDNGVVTHGYWMNARDTFGELKASREGEPSFMQPEWLWQHREGKPPVRFPKYNAWALRKAGLFEEE